MGYICIIQISNTNPDFYSVIGPYLSRREIVKELGYTIGDENDKTWFVSLDKDRVLGWVVAIPSKKVVIFYSDYVLPEYRENGIYSQLYNERNKKYKDVYTQTTVTASSMSRYLKDGFIEVRKRGEYTVVERKP